MGFLESCLIVPDSAYFSALTRSVDKPRSIREGYGAALSISALAFDNPVNEGVQLVAGRCRG